jgi:hypothetical protein
MENDMKINQRTLKIGAVILSALVLVLSGFLVFSARAQNSMPTGDPGTRGVNSTSNFIPVQGRLTDYDGNPLDGMYNLTFRIYDVSMAGVPLCSDTRAVIVSNGLFSTYMLATGCAEDIDGRQLYLSIEVESDGEMNPRAFLDNVPYAWTFRPGAKVTSDISSPLLTLNNTANGEGVWAVSAHGDALHGYSGTSNGVAAYSTTGTGLYANSLDGLAIEAAGTGIIASTAPTYLWISGSDIRPYTSSDSTVISMDTTGGAKLERGDTAGTKYAMLPVTIAGTLYGQNVTITAIDIYWVAETEFDGITDLRVRRQSDGVCPSCFVDLLHDGDDHVCDTANNPGGCMLHYDLESNNELNPDSGVIHIGFGLDFSGDSTYVDIGGVRLTLEYHE